MGKHEGNARGEVDGAETLDPASAETTTLERQDPASASGESAAPVEDAAGVGAQGGDQAAAAAGGQSADAGTLARELESARQSAAENMDAMLRARAELDNVRKRAEREIDNARKFALERFMGELLAVRDSMELGLDAARGGEADVARLREGLELTLKLFDTATGKFGLEEVDPAGEAFDPELHQAMSMQDSSDVASGTVITVVQKGYRLNERLLRPAMVIVAK